MEAMENTLQVSKTARYYQLGDVGGQTKRIWFALHGYGQLASYFIRHFEGLANETTVIVAPEGLSRFYLDGKWDRVGATWMTKEDRLHEIEDYISYLDQLLESLTSGLNHVPEIYLLGFSQGTATAWRWMMKGKIQPSQLILWAGGIATDAVAGAGERMAGCGLHFVLGDADEYITFADAEARIEDLRKIKPEARLWRFVGNHRMDAEVLQKIDEELSI
jgi:predicted esterase